MKTCKFYYYTIAAFLIFILASCNSSYFIEPENENSESNQNEEVEDDFTPNSVAGKTIKIDSETFFFGFTSSGSCAASCSTLENVSGTPQYSYSRTNGTQANFWAKYIDKRTNISEYTKTTTTYYRTSERDYTLTFSNESCGTYSGTLTISTSGYSIGSIHVSAKTHTYSAKGSFSIY